MDVTQIQHKDLENESFAFNITVSPKEITLDIHSQTLRNDVKHAFQVDHWIPLYHYISSFPPLLSRFHLLRLTSLLKLPLAYITPPKWSALNGFSPLYTFSEEDLDAALAAPDSWQYSVEFLLLRSGLRRVRLSFFALPQVYGNEGCKIILECYMYDATSWGSSWSGENPCSRLMDRVHSPLEASVPIFTLHEYPWMTETDLDLALQANSLLWYVNFVLSRDLLLTDRVQTVSPFEKRRMSPEGFYDRTLFSDVILAIFEGYFSRIDHDIPGYHEESMKRLLATKSFDFSLVRFIPLTDMVSLIIKYNHGSLLQEYLDLCKEHLPLDHFNEELSLSNTLDNPLCMASTQNKPDIIPILLSNGADYGLARQILQGAGLTEAVEILITTALNYYLAWTSDQQKRAPLRSRFYNEYYTITDKVFFTNRESDTPIEPRNTVYYEWGPHSSRKSAETAWEDSLAILKKACRGNLPRTAHGVLLFTALTKAMSSEIDDKEGSTFERDLLADLNRWNILMDRSPDELEALTRAIRNIWGIDIREQTSNSNINADSRLTGGFMDMLQHFQDLANDLVQTSHEVLADPGLSNPHIMAGREETLRRSSTASGDPLAQRHARAPWPPKPPDKRYQVIEGVVLIVMAGVAFAVVFAYLISEFRSFFRYMSVVNAIYPQSPVAQQRCIEGGGNPRIRLCAPSSTVIIR